VSAPCAYADLPPKRLAAFAPYLRMVNSRLFRLPSTEGWRGQLLGSYDFGRVSRHLEYGSPRVREGHNHHVEREGTLKRLKKYGRDGFLAG